MGVRRRKREMVDGMIAIHRKKFAVPHLEFLLAEGRLVGPRTVEARLPEGGTRRFVADRLFLNLGTRATIPASRVLPTLSRSPMSRRSSSAGSRRT